MSPDARAQRRDTVRDAKRAIILDAAIEVFQREGLEGASMRAIGEAAGYTAAAIYFHFASKEEIYAALLGRSLDRLLAAVEAAATVKGSPRRQLEATALAFFDFYAANPRDLDLGFYLFRGGMRPRGVTAQANAMLNDKLARSLAGFGVAARALGASPRHARALTADMFAHAAGLLLLEHTGRIRIFQSDTRRLMQAHVARIVRELGEGP